MFNLFISTRTYHTKGAKSRKLACLQGRDRNYMKTVACLLSGLVILLLVGCGSIGAPGNITRQGSP